VYNRDFQKLRFYTHKLKGSILTLGIEGISGFCEDLEKAAEDKKIFDNTVSRNTELNEYMQTVIAELNQIREKYTKLQL